MTATTCPACGDLVEPSDDPTERVCTHLTCKAWEHVASYDHRQGRWVRPPEMVTTETPDPLALARYYALKADGSFADGLSRIASEIEALRALVVQAHRDSWSDDGEQMWACRGLVALSDEQVPVLLRALANGGPS